MKMFGKFIFASLLSLGTLGSAQQQTMTIDPASSNVAFALTGTGHEVHGTFHVSQGTIKFDRTAPAMSGSVVVSAASGDSNDKSRDKKMHSDVLDVAHYADVTFEPKSYQGTIASTGDSNIQASGVFTLHGTPHDITVPMQVHIEGPNVTAKGSFIVPYVQWGLKDPSIMFLKVAKEVHVTLDLHGTLSSRN
jgi:polyisoprenoid-binding protein YceI